MEMNQPLGSEPLTHLMDYPFGPIHIDRFLAKKGVLSGGALGLNTLCRGCSSCTTLVGLLYLRGDKLKKVCTVYKF